jgi:hypothetical protein
VASLDRALLRDLCIVPTLADKSREGLFDAGFVFLHE